MSEADLLAAGFREGSASRGSPHDREWWRTERGPGGDGKKFAVTIRFWRFSKYSTAERAVEDGWDAKAYFQDAAGVGFWVERSVRHESPVDVLAWFRAAWSRLGCAWNEPAENPNEVAT